MENADRMANLGSALKFARESKKGSNSQRSFAHEIGFSQSYLSAVDSGKRIPSERAVEAMINALDPLPCQRNECEGRVDCDNCRVSTIVKGIEFDLERGQHREFMVFDLNITYLMGKLGLSDEQQIQVRNKIIRSAVEICLEVAKEDQITE